LSLTNAMNYLIDTVRENHGQRDRTLEEMNAMFDYLVNDHMEQLAQYATGAITDSPHEKTINNLQSCTRRFIKSLSAQIMVTDNDQEAYTRRGDEVQKWSK